MRNSARHHRSITWTAGALVPALLLVVAATTGAGAATPRSASARVVASARTGSLPTSGTTSVIVVLKDQLPATPAKPALAASRKAQAEHEQAPVVAALSGAGAKDVHMLSTINAVTATVSAAEARSLASDPAVAEVVPDEPIPVAKGSAPATQAAASLGTPVAPLPGACPAPGQVDLAPQALSLIHADSQDPSVPTARSLGFTGAGVKVAFIADGLDTKNQEFIRPNGSKVFVDYKDFSGDGPKAPTDGGEAFGDAGSIAAQGTGVYDVSNYNPIPLDQPCKVRIEGVAPGSSLVGLNVFGTDADAFDSVFLQAIDYAVTVDHVNVINESFGGNPFPDTPTLDLIDLANDEAVAAGVTVVVSSGDSGITNTIGSPATDPAVISAGASTSYQLYAQDGYGGIRLPGVTGWLDNNISGLSSGGFDQTGRTLDVVAPGDLNWAPCSTNVKKFADCTNLAGQPTPIQDFGGTSESAPLTSGVAALVMQAYAKTHAGALPSPTVVKQIITSTADDIGAPSEQQGAGLIDAYKAVLAAESYADASGGAATGQTLLTGTPQLNAVTLPSTAQTLRDTVTNSGTSTRTIAVSSRQLGSYSTIASGTVTLSDTSGIHPPDWVAGNTDNVESVTFVVPAGVDRLSTSIAYQGVSLTDLDARVRLSLVDPSGKLASYSIPQGIGNYGTDQVADPEPGTWTAYIFGRDSAGGGTTGPVLWRAQTATWTSFGSVSPSSLTLAPGQSAPVTLKVKTPRTPGDASGSIVLTDPASSGPSVTTVPVTLRSLVPAGSTTFNDSITGPNGRDPVDGVTAWYQTDVPVGQPELNAGVTLADDPNNPFLLELVDPAGVAVATSTNTSVGINGSGVGAVAQLGTQVHALAPTPGRWTVVANFYNNVSGTALTTPFTVHTDTSAVPVSAPGLPSGPATVLPAKKPTVVNVTVTNTGSSPEAYFIDGRLSSSAVYDLAPQTGADSTLPLGGDANVPEYLVPTETSTIAAAATTASTPIALDFGWSLGDPDIGSTVDGVTTTGQYSATPVPQGTWEVTPDLIGPFTKRPKTVAVATSLTARTAAFDGAVSAGTGDLWFESLDPSALVNPVVVPAGQSATIPVTITPSGKKGTTVSGTLYVDDTSLITYGALEPTGAAVAALPYQYTVG